MCQICGSSLMSYAPSTSGAEVPVYGGSGANTAISQGATSDTNTNGVLSGVKWSAGTLTYSFPTLTSQYEVGYSETGNNFSAAPEATKAAIRYAMNLLSQYTNMVTSEVSGSTAADVRAAFSDDASPTAYAYYPSNGTKGGDIWFSNAYPDYANPTKGDYGWATVIHELGHALGLKHGHETGGPGNTAMLSAFDQMAYSIMTYRSYQNAPLTGYTNEQFGFAQTYMMYDIAALQTMYGANFNTNSGNTTYTWNASTGEMSIDGVGQGAPGGNRIFMTLWDGNGVDTYDFSNYATNLTINLTPGSFSITSATQLANLGNGNYAPGNIFNALQFGGDVRSLIENAIGGSGNDTITGNAANNYLTGNGGTDTLNGDDGNDYLRGGLGGDTLNGGNGYDYALYDLATSGVTASLVNSIVNVGESVNDTFSSIEGLVGSNFNDVLQGDNNVSDLYGGNGDDTLFGEGGNDFLYGQEGNDHLHGGAGADVLSGGNGIDYARYDLSTSAVSAWLNTPGSNTGDASGDVYISIEGLVGSNYNDILSGDNNQNTIYGLQGDDILLGQGGDDFIFGGDGQDHFYGGSGNDYFDGGNGVDIAHYEDATSGVTLSVNNPSGNTGDASGDFYVSIEGVMGSNFTDSIYGSSVNEFFFGGGGSDHIYAGGGADYIDGGDGIDYLRFDAAGGGVTFDFDNNAVNTGDAAGDAYTSVEGVVGSGFADRLISGVNAEYFYGGGGADTFVFSRAISNSTVDSIFDFTHGVDQIELASSIFSALSAGTLSASAFVTGTGATTTAHRIIYNPTNGELAYDADGSGAGSAVVFARLTTGLALTEADFLIA